MDLTTVSLFVWACFLLVIGYLLPFIQSKKLARFLTWSLIVISTILSIYISHDKSALYRMVAIVSIQLFAMKSIVMVESYTGKPKLSFIQWLSFAGGWFGMRPSVFESLFSKSMPDYIRIFLKGLSRILIGVSLLYLSQLINNQGFKIYFLSELLALVGLSFILHFGILNLSTAQWRFLGVNVKELFNAPFKSKSLKEFWGRRWNVAFSEMTALIAYRPLKGLGQNWAMFLSFLLSGILHEIAISFPVESGYGLPFLYFLIHGLMMYAESEVKFLANLLNHPILSRLWVFFWLIIPMPILFHTDFIQNVIFPLRDLILEIWG
jgi:Membrane bound O-acyl transferase family